MKGRFIEPQFTDDGDTIVRLLTKEDVTLLCDNLMGHDVDAVMKRWRPRRSHEANAYYWTLLTKAAAKLEISSPRAHNLMLQKYGTPELLDGQLVYMTIPETKEAQEQALESQEYHMKPTSHVREGKDGQMYRTYIMMRGSHYFNTEEMAALINGLVYECQQMGIETRCQEDIDSMIEAFDAR